MIPGLLPGKDPENSLNLKIFFLVLKPSGLNASRRCNFTSMGISKTEIFTDKQNVLARFAKVLGHPARIAILENLFQRETCVCGDLVGEIGLAQPTISQHLKELKQLGLIKGTIEGTSVCYCIDKEAWAEMKSLLKEFLDQDVQNPECC